MKKTVCVTIALFGLAVSGTAMAGDGNSRTSKESVNWFFDGSDTGGESRLTRTGNMVLLLLEAENLTPGDAHTIWFIVFNNPRACSAPGCGEDDIFNPDGSLNVGGVMAAEIAIGNATGNVAKADGTAEFGARLVQNENLPGHQIVFPAGLTSGYLLTTKPKKAEVHLIVQTHGQAMPLPGLLPQLTYLEANCNPNCEDIQFAVHKALGN